MEKPVIRPYTPISSATRASMDDTTLRATLSSRSLRSPVFPLLVRSSRQLVGSTGASSFGLCFAMFWLLHALSGRVLCKLDGSLVSSFKRLGHNLSIRSTLHCSVVHEQHSRLFWPNQIIIIAVLLWSRLLPHDSSHSFTAAFLVYCLFGEAMMW